MPEMGIIFQYSFTNGLLLIVKVSKISFAAIKNSETKIIIYYLQDNILNSGLSALDY